jgi:hypothetical protein
MGTKEKIIKKQQEAAKKRVRLKKDKAKIKELYENKKWYTIRSILGNTWAS